VNTVDVKQTRNSFPYFGFNSWARAFDINEVGQCFSRTVRCGDLRVVSARSLKSFQTERDREGERRRDRSLQWSRAIVEDVTTATFLRGGMASGSSRMALLFIFTALWMEWHRRSVRSNRIKYASTPLCFSFAVTERCHKTPTCNSDTFSHDDIDRCCQIMEASIRWFLIPRWLWSNPQRRLIGSWRDPSEARVYSPWRGHGGPTKCWWRLVAIKTRKVLKILRRQIDGWIRTGLDYADRCG